MSPAEALRQIRGYAKANRIVVLTHAWQRMKERGVSYGDMMHGLTNAQSARWQVDHQSWKVSTEDLTGDDLTIAVKLQGGVVVVTVF